MTFDDGILAIYEERNTAENARMPKKERVLKSKHYYSYDVLGYNRYYTALQANQKISAVINIPEWQDITPLDIAELEDGNSYIVRLAQKMHDNNNLKITKLTLEAVKQ